MSIDGERLVCDKGYKPNLELPSTVSEAMRQILQLGTQRDGTPPKSRRRLAGMPCKVMSGYKAAFWLTSPNYISESGILMTVQPEKAAPSLILADLYIGVVPTEQTFDIEMSGGVDAAEVATYSVDSLSVAIEGLYAFLYPSGARYVNFNAYEGVRYH